MANSDKDRSMAGVAALLLVVAVVVLVLATSVAAGFAFGATYGFVALSAWALIIGAALVRTIRKLVGDGRDDG